MFNDRESFLTREEFFIEESTTVSLKNERVIYVAKNFEAGLIDVTANIRRNGASVATAVALSDIGNGRYELLLTPALLGGYGGAGYYDFYINSASKNAPAISAKWILEADSDDLEAHLGVIEGKIDILDTNLDAAQIDLTSVKATVEDTNADINHVSTGLPNLKVLIDSIQSTVDNISNVTRFSAPIPNPMVKLDTGTKVYALPARLFDMNGNPEDPDLNQIQLKITDSSGASKDALINGFTVQPHYITRDAAGIYSYQLDVLDSETLGQLNFEFIYVEGGVTNSQVSTTELISEASSAGMALEATSQSILADTAAMQPQVADIQTKVNDATYGLAALKALIDTIDTVVDSNSAELANGTYGLSALKDLINNGASQVSVTAITTNLDNNVKGAGFASGTDSLKAISDRVYNGGSAA